MFFCFKKKKKKKKELSSWVLEFFTTIIPYEKYLYLKYT
jgi:hypothetical protein